MGYSRKDESPILVDREIAFVKVFSKSTDDIWTFVDSSMISAIRGCRLNCDRNGHVRFSSNPTKYLSRLLMDIENEKGMNIVVDHIDHNPLNNRNRLFADQDRELIVVHDEPKLSTLVSSGNGRESRERVSFNVKPKVKLYTKLPGRESPGSSYEKGGWGC